MEIQQPQKSIFAFLFCSSFATIAPGTPNYSVRHPLWASLRMLIFHVVGTPSIFEIFRWKLKVDGLTSWLKWLWWKCGLHWGPVYPLSSSSTPILVQPRALRAWKQKWLLEFIHFLPFQLFENWFDYLGEHGHLSEKGTDSVNPLWEGQAKEGSFAVSCSTWGSWHYHYLWPALWSWECRFSF